MGVIDEESKEKERREAGICISDERYAKKKKEE